MWVGIHVWMGICACVCACVWVVFVVTLVADTDMSCCGCNVGDGVAGMGNQWMMVVLKKEE